MQAGWWRGAARVRPASGEGARDDAQWQAKGRKHYHAQWRRHFAPRLRLAAVFAHVAMRPAVCAPLLAGLSYWPSLLTQGARWAGKIRCAPDPASIAWLAAGLSGRSEATSLNKEIS